MSKKITAMSSIAGTGLDPVNDYVEVVDTSDTTDAPTGTNKKIPVGQVALAFQQSQEVVASQPDVPGLFGRSYSSPSDGGWTAINYDSGGQDWYWGQHAPDGNVGSVCYLTTGRVAGTVSSATFQAYAEDDAHEECASTIFFAQVQSGVAKAFLNVAADANGDLFDNPDGRGITMSITDQFGSGDTTVKIEMQSGQTAAAFKITNASNAIQLQVTPSGDLDLATTTGALIVPRLTTTERNALTAQNGMIVYDTTLNQFYKRQNGSWTSF